MLLAAVICGGNGGRWRPTLKNFFRETLAPRARWCILVSMESVLTPEQRKAYDAGWKAGQAPTAAKVEAADKRRAPSHWYLGFFDAEAGNEKYETSK